MHDHAACHLFHLRLWVTRRRSTRARVGDGMLRVLVDDQVDFRQTFAGVRISTILGSSR